MDPSRPGLTPELKFLSRLAESTPRRRFLKWAGVTVAVATVGCGDDITNTNVPPPPPPVPPTTPDIVSLGSGDTGILNYAFALEQLEAAFYTQVVASFYAGATPAEQSILTDIRDHEVVHRDFLRAALGGAAIRDLQVDFTSVNFADRTSVLTTARTFEDLGVSAYNGAGRRLTDANLLLVAGKIVSVEARHASAIRDLLNPMTAAFAGDDVIDEQGLDVVNEPVTVLAAANPFVVEVLNPSQLPR